MSKTFNADQNLLKSYKNKGRLMMVLLIVCAFIQGYAGTILCGGERIQWELAHHWDMEPDTLRAIAWLILIPATALAIFAFARNMKYTQSAKRFGYSFVCLEETKVTGMSFVTLSDDGTSFEVPYSEISRAEFSNDDIFNLTIYSHSRVLHCPAISKAYEAARLINERAGAAKPAEAAAPAAKPDVSIRVGRPTPYVPPTAASAAPAAPASAASSAPAPTPAPAAPVPATPAAPAKPHAAPKFCGSCGAPLSPEMTACYNCGKPV